MKSLDYKLPISLNADPPWSNFMLHLYKFRYHQSLSLIHELSEEIKTQHRVSVVQISHCIPSISEKGLCALFLFSISSALVYKIH